MKIRRTLSILLAVALLCSLLAVPEAEAKRMPPETSPTES